MTVDKAARGRPAVLFDRDGVLNVDHGYVVDPAALDWMPGARPAVRRLNEAGILAIVVSNQSGVARGYFDEAAVDGFHAAMQAQLAEVGAHIDGFYYCPFHEDAVSEVYRHADHPDRKPNPGMVLRAIADFGLDTARTVMIGDKASDMAAARAGGVRGLLYEGGDLEALITSLPFMGRDSDA